MYRKSVFFLYISLLMSVSLACGMAANLPASGTQLPTQTSTAVNFSETGVWMVVVNAPDGLYVRPEAGDLSTYTDVLHNGDEVFCTDMKTGGILGDGIWCKHREGWSNARWLKAVR